MIVYFDDILVYSKDVDNHVEDLRRGLTKLSEKKLRLDLTKVFAVRD